MNYLNHLINSTGYLRWLVILGVGLAAVVAVWVLAKALKWTLLLAFGAIVVVLVLSGLFWLFG
jgi:ABC-type transport system involved in cytochrome bd biosynthesis fused ATPase/permease subunit